MSLVLEGVWAYYDPIPALKGVSLRLDAGAVVAILGPNGAGKTTLLKTISGLIKARQGSIRFEGADLIGQSPDAIARTGIVQVPEGRQVYPPFTVLDNLRMGYFARGGRAGSRDAAMERVFELFPELLPFRKKPAGSLSGGQQQMVAIGRALMAEPKVLMLDEPSLGLAPKVVARIFDTLKKLRDEGCTILLVEQNVHLALELASRAYVVELGSVVLSGTSAELLANDRVQKVYLGVDEPNSREAT